eukprot:3360399-Pyramimonas_sp.AAC.1
MHRDIALLERQGVLTSRLASPKVPSRRQPCRSSDQAASELLVKSLAYRPLVKAFSAAQAIRSCRTQIARNPSLVIRGFLSEECYASTDSEEALRRVLRRFVWGLQS